MTRFIAAVGCLIGIIASAWVGAAVQAHFSRARPLVELSYVALTDGTRPSDELRMTAELRKLYERIPFKLKDWRNPTTIEELDVLIAGVRDRLDQLGEADRALNAVVTLLKNRANELFVDGLRLELLEEWTRAAGNALDKTMQNALLRSDFLTKVEQNATYNKYMMHPDEWRRLSVSIALPGVLSYDLSEDPIDDDDTSRMKIAKTVINIQRRLWIYMDRNHLLEIMNSMESLLSAYITDTQRFVALLTTRRNAVYPERLLAVVVLSNHGSRAAVFRSMAFLGLQTADGIKPIELHARQAEEITGESVIVVRGGETAKVEFYSRDTSEMISQSQLKGGSDALNMLYKTEAVDCNVVLYRLQGSGKSKAVRSIYAARFGKSASDRIANELRDELASAFRSKSPQ